MDQGKLLQVKRVAQYRASWCSVGQYIAPYGPGGLREQFINWQADAIKKEDPEVLVTIGVWNPKSCTNNFGLAKLHYSDACLYKAGKRQMGKLDFYQFHTYSWAGKFDNVSPFMNKYSDYGASKPIVIGEFNKKNGGGRSFKQLFDYAYGHGYAGAWSWDLVSKGRDIDSSMIQNPSTYCDATIDKCNREGQARGRGATRGDVCRLYKEQFDCIYTGCAFLGTHKEVINSLLEVELETLGFDCDLNNGQVSARKLETSTLFLLISLMILRNFVSEF
ncbi:hypothetical protein RRG08_065081 [Elysia crispata]|uniref:Mannan endo-1,4-beta-mannosidase n=1 Tax=Elysia crispata TaxID=231223 RepID=A0AAE0XZ51_9GAST|nr:hypothetical protein RRG08_065081 [Elysia crispata]